MGRPAAGRVALSHPLRIVGPVLFPPRCPLCTSLGAAPCAGCVGRLAPAASVRPPTGFVAVVALLAYRGDARRLIAALKFRGNRATLAWLADGLVLRLLALGPALDPSAVVTWAPTSAARRRRRGFDQAELLARALAHRAGLPVLDLLRRQPGLPVTGRPGAERAGLVHFVARRAPPPHVVVVDDVLTTGATLAAAGAVLRHHGAAGLVAAVAAATPPPGGPEPSRRATRPHHQIGV